MSHHVPTHPADETELGGGGPARRIGLVSLVFMIIAASAPLTVLAGGLPTSYAVAGNLAVPIGYIVLAVVVGFFAVGYGAMSAAITNAGAFYAYITAGLGVRQGIGAAVLALVSYNAMQIGLYGLLGFTVSSFLASSFGLTVPWWASGAFAWVLIGILGVMRLDLSAKLVAILVIGEFVVAIIATVIALDAAPEGISAQPFDPARVAEPGFGAILAFGIAAFMGFESGAIYSEETRDPERTVGRATAIAIAIIGSFYAFCAWALAMGIGPSQIIEQAQEYGPDLLFVFLGEQAGTALVTVANLLFITSLIAALLVFHNAAARYFFALARPGVLPTALARVSPRTGAPVAGSLAQSVLALVVVAVFAVIGSGSELGELFPVITLFTWLTNAAAFGLVFLLCVTAIAQFGFFRRHAGHSGVFTRVVAPLVAALGLGTVFLLILLNFDILIGAEGNPALVVVMPAIILGAGVAGLVRGEYLRRRRPAVFAAASRELDQA